MTIRARIAPNAWICVAALVSSLGLAGCKATEEPEAAPDRNLARLRSLSYLGGTVVSPAVPTGVLRFEKENASSGYRLYTIQALGRAELISLQGQVVRTWQHRDLLVLTLERRMEPSVHPDQQTRRLCATRFSRPVRDQGQEIPHEVDAAPLRARASEHLPDRVREPLVGIRDHQAHAA